MTATQSDAQSRRSPSEAAGGLPHIFEPTRNGEETDLRGVEYDTSSTPITCEREQLLTPSITEAPSIQPSELTTPRAPFIPETRISLRKDASESPEIIQSEPLADPFALPTAATSSLYNHLTSLGITYEDSFGETQSFFPVPSFHWTEERDLTPITPRKRSRSKDEANSSFDGTPGCKASSVPSTASARERHSVSIDNKEHELHSKPEEYSRKPSNLPSRRPFVGHRWTYRDRVYLCVLRRNYCNRGEDLTLVMNQVLQEAFQASGERGLGTRVYTVQWRDLQAYQKHQAWIDSCRNTVFGDPGKRWVSYVRDLEAAAEKVSVTLHPSSEDLKNVVSTDRWKKKKPPTVTPSSITESLESPAPQSLAESGREEAPLDEGLQWYASQEVTESEDSFQLPKDTNPIEHAEQSTSVGNSSETKESFRVTDNADLTNIAQTSEGEHGRIPLARSNRPCIVYRCYDDSSVSSRLASGLRAQRFLSMPDKAPPSFRLDDQFYWDYSNHLWHHKLGSPFLSTTSSFLETFRRGIRSHEAGLEPRIAIISFDGIEQNAFHAAPYIRRLGDLGFLDDMKSRSRYKGTREYVVWGEIPSSAIIKDMKFSKIMDLTLDLEMHDLLRLNHRNSSEKRTLAIKTHYLSNPINLRSSTSNLLGCLAALLGFEITSPESWISEVIDEFANGFVIEEGFVNPYGHSPHLKTGLELLGPIFVNSLGKNGKDPRLPPVEQFEALTNAFCKGINRAAKTLANERKRKKEIREWRESQKELKEQVLGEESNDSNEEYVG